MYSNSMHSIPILNKILLFTPNHCSHSKLDIPLMGFYPLRTAPLLGFLPQRVDPFAAGISPTRRTMSRRFTDGIFPTQKRLWTTLLLRFFPTRRIMSSCSTNGTDPTLKWLWITPLLGFLPFGGLCLGVPLMGFFSHESDCELLHCWDFSYSESTLLLLGFSHSELALLLLGFLPLISDCELLLYRDFLHSLALL